MVARRGESVSRAGVPAGRVVRIVTRAVIGLGLGIGATAVPFLLAIRALVGRVVVLLVAGLPAPFVRIGRVRAVVRSGLRIGAALVPLLVGIACRRRQRGKTERGARAHGEEAA